MVQIQGKNFGTALAALSIQLNRTLNTTHFDVTQCIPCSITHTRARCVTSVNRGYVPPFK